jgi:urease subunit gamma
MRLSPADQDKLLLSVAGMLARDRRERGVELNQPEAVALLSCWVIERAREGRSVADLMDAGRHVLAREDVMEGVPELVDEVQVEATFRGGPRIKDGRIVALGKARSRLGALGQRIPCRLSSITSSAFSAVTNSGPVGISSPSAGNSRWRARSARSTIGR